MKDNAVMRSVEVTPRIWNHILAIRNGARPPGDFGWTKAERAALALYGPVARRDGDARVVAQIGQSLDGRIATVSGDSASVSGPDGLAHLHRLRALVDGIVIGVKTALLDKPRLTVRLCTGRNPARIIIDPKGRLPDDATVFRSDGARRIVVQGIDRPRPHGVEILRLGARAGWINPAEILPRLQETGLSSILVEGGGTTIAGFLEAGQLDRMQVSVAPLIIGAGPQSLTMSSAVTRLSDALRPPTSFYAIGSDIVFDCVIPRLTEGVEQTCVASPI
ncbi:RibD family protein [Paracoccus sp. MBLB3053]|uniref:RibD family protein n=1 Tax=Paracoccus aurantius TaxID=3073814 RepID=A0ABU2HNT9_9RHOB|nr:RibD family protein [Paracoccus sp. MBLB3053]MDS9466205.1 RibD family protein [Paracoccus sp. MBLB3053]